MGNSSSRLLQLIGDESWKEMPWKHFKSPVEQFKVLPTFAAIEWTYRIACWSCFLHATKTGGLPLWFSSWLCGTANDIFFIFMPFCDNFWQAQASVMITPRLPLYIVEMYATIVYLSSTAARQFNLPYLSEATLTGLLAHVLYGVYDINGPPFLWWTWHDGDPSISKRQNNAPLGSSMWILTYISLHQLLLRFCEFPPTYDVLRPFQTKLNKAPWALRIAFSGFVCTPMFMSLMGLFQIFSMDTIGVPGKRTYRLTLMVYVLITVQGFIRAHRSGALQLPKMKTTEAANKKLLVIVAAFYAVNAGIAFFGDSTKHVSTGCHQKYHKESKLVKDVMGFDREDHIVGDGPLGFSKNDYGLVEKPKPDAEWYTVIGKKRQNKTSDIKLLMFMTSMGLIGYSTAFTNCLSLPSFLK